MRPYLYCVRASARMVRLCTASAKQAEAKATASGWMMLMREMAFGTARRVGRPDQPAVFLPPSSASLFRESPLRARLNASVKRISGELLSTWHAQAAKLHGGHAYRWPLRGRSSGRGRGSNPGAPCLPSSDEQAPALARASDGITEDESGSLRSGVRQDCGDSRVCCAGQRGLPVWLGEEAFGRFPRDRGLGRLSDSQQTSADLTGVFQHPLEKRVRE